MTQLLNRFAWAISITLGVLITFGYGGNDEIMLFIGLLLATIIKSLFFSHNYITSRLHHFKKALRQADSKVIVTQVHNEIVNSKNQKISQSNSSQVVDESENIPLIEDEYKNNDFEPLTYKKTKNDNKALYSQDEYEDSKSENFLTNFFSENILAKIGGILVFLGVIFLLTLVWNVIPGVLKIIIGFTIGLGTYFAGVKLDQKGLIQEGRILLGLAILINYAVILAGRYIIGDTNIDSTPIFNTGISFIFLIANTIFAVLTALYYKSIPLLIFSFAFAYLNPFLIGMQDTTPYILLGYSIILSLGALYLSISEKNTWLLVLAFVLGNLLIFSAPNMSGNEEIGYVIKFISMIGLTLLSLLTAIKMEEKTKTFIELLFAGAFFLVGFFGLLGGPSEIAINSYLLSIIAGFIFMGFSYFQMHKWPYLYSIGSIGGALVLSSILIWDTTEFIIYSILTTFSYLAINIYGALKLKINDNNALKNLIIGSISGILFIGFEIYRYSAINEQPLVLPGILYFILAFIYFGIAYFISNKIGITAIKENTLHQNILYNFLGISLSLVSIAIALIFAEYDYVIPLFWLFESSILLYFFKRIGDIKIFIAGLVLMLLGVLAFWSKIALPIRGEYFYLITFGLIALSLVLNIIFTRKKESSLLNNIYHDLHDYLHIIALILILIFVSGIFNTQYYLITLGVIMSGAGYIYKKYGSIILQSIFVIIIFLGFFFHIMNVFEILQAPTFNHLLQYIISLVLIGAVYIFIKTPKTTIHKSPLITISSIYLFIITSIFIYQIFPNIFSITLYWGALAFILISRGIGKDIIALRTTGLYLIMLMCLKIFFIDIPYSIDETIIKVVAFIAVGIMLIVISSMYSKKYGNKLKGEYQLSNLLGKTLDQEERNETKVHGKSTPHGETVKANIKTEIDINQKINDINIEGIDSLIFQPNDGKTFSTKAKNLLKIVVMIMGNETEKSFEANELLESYNYVMKNYKSDLSQRDLDRITGVVFDFVKKGGTVTVKK